jgi:hypothetical protein
VLFPDLPILHIGAVTGQLLVQPSHFLSSPIFIIRLGNELNPFRTRPCVNAGIYIIIIYFFRNI